MSLQTSPTPAAGGIGLVEVPRDFIALPQTRASAVEHRLGYFRDARFVIFAFCPAGGEVLWKDDTSAGFGTGGWQTFLFELAPAAARRGAWLGSLESAGTHVILLDREQGIAFAAPRERAEAFLARAYGRERPGRPCLCQLLECAQCATDSCIFHPSRRR